jgi:hypothetical protein
MTIARILPVVSVIERRGIDTWRFRLVGTEIERRWGRTITGSDCFQRVSPAAAAIMRRELKCVVEWPCGSWSRRRLELQSGRVTVVETLRLPMSAKDGASKQILSCSGELGGNMAMLADLTRGVMTVVDQEYFDIGAGFPAPGAMAAGATA